MRSLKFGAFTILLIGPRQAASKLEISVLDAHLQNLQSAVFPELEAISRDIFAHPEISRNETFAHDVSVNHFCVTKSGEWEVDASISDELPTAWKIEFSHTPASWPQDRTLPAVGFLAEYDALLELGVPSHACGHNHIWLTAVYAASLARQALIDFDIPGRIIAVGTPDEEQNSGKFVLDEAGIFDGSLVWLLAHPSISAAIQPMSSRQNIVVRVVKDTHFAAVKTAYSMLTPLVSLQGLPGQFSTAALIEEVGMFQCNVVQADVALGVIGPTISRVNDTINSVKASHTGFESTNFTLAIDPEIENGIQILFHGNAGHTSQANQGALTLSILSFQQLTSIGDSFEFYLPDNTTSNELDFLVDVRTRWTPDLQTVIDFVLSHIPTQNITLDRSYPAVEPDPFLGPHFIDTISRSAYGAQKWPLSTTPPAASDASWVQRASVSPNGNGTFTVDSVHKAVLHANYNICTTGNITLCPFNHDPPFASLAGADFAYAATEQVARAVAAVAVQLLDDPNLMAKATAHIAQGPKNRK
ncbi:hypothetical protein GQ53DRAFT_886113, partial [Thozetella sp. PMI_491]